MKITHARSALAVIGSIFATAMTPVVPMPPAAWAAEHLVVPDGEYKGQLYDPKLTPYLTEILDALSPDSPDNEVVVMKSAQTGFTLALLISIAHSIDRDPCDMMVVQPTDSTLTDFNSQKLGRVIEASEILAKKIKPQTARSGQASTTYEKKFGSHSLTLAIATSSADLSSKTIKKVYLDEIDRYPDDVDGQGSPIELAAGRQTMFLKSGTWKRLLISTPTIKGASAIETAYLLGDQRRWHVGCPQCDGRFVFEYGPQFRFDQAYPYNAYYVAPCCGRPIQAWEKDALVLLGRWQATAPAAGKFKSYHFDAFSSPFVPWNEIAKRIVGAGDDPDKQKPLYNLVFGWSFEIKGDALDHAELLKRREDYKRGHIPPGALLLTIAADVQMRGIYYEVLAHAPDRQTWVVDYDYLDGETTDVDEGAFLKLTEIYAKDWPDAYGNRWRPDEFLVDAGYRTQTVYEWTRRHPGTKAIKGEDGWNKPPLGVATDQDVDYRGRRIKGGVKLRVVGGWDLKAKFYTYLAREAKYENGSAIYPSGYCHFHRELDENYFKMITGEYLVDEKYRGRTRKVWKERSNGVGNHMLDCRIYNLAAVSAYMASFTADDWARLAKERGIPEDMRTPDLFAPRAFADAAAPAAKPAEVKQSAVDPYARLAKLNQGL